MSCVSCFYNLYSHCCQYNRLLSTLGEIQIELPFKLVLSTLLHSIPFIPAPVSQSSPLHLSLPPPSLSPLSLHLSLFFPIDDYTDMPINEFGAAMLKGMGWKPGEAIGLNISLHDDNVVNEEEEGCWLV